VVLVSMRALFSSSHFAMTPSSAIMSQTASGAKANRITRASSPPPPPPSAPHAAAPRVTATEAATSWIFRLFKAVLPFFRTCAARERRRPSCRRWGTVGPSSLAPRVACVTHYRGGDRAGQWLRA
jgi:hypothetical protein